jgi:hypothetical protein
MPRRSRLQVHVSPMRKTGANKRNHPHRIESAPTLPLPSNSRNPTAPTPLRNPNLHIPKPKDAPTSTLNPRPRTHEKPTTQPRRIRYPRLTRSPSSCTTESKAFCQHASAIHDPNSTDLILSGTSGFCLGSHGTSLHRENCTRDSGQSRIFLSVSDRNASPSCTAYNAGRSQRSQNLSLAGHSGDRCWHAAYLSVPSGPHVVRRAASGLGRNRCCKHRTVLHPQRGRDGLVCSWEFCLKANSASLIEFTLSPHSFITPSRVMTADYL